MITLYVPVFKATGQRALPKDSLTEAILWVMEQKRMSDWTISTEAGEPPANQVPQADQGI